jgi:HD-GYP domain-containing protein (c-di-GMP phosphodiesterase class II)
LAGERIPLEARIVAVADAYDAMTTARVYHNETSPSQAINEIQASSGSRYDPKIVEAFLKVLNRLKD